MEEDAFDSYGQQEAKNEILDDVDHSFHTFMDLVNDMGIEQRFPTVGLHEAKIGEFRQMITHYERSVTSSLMRMTSEIRSVFMPLLTDIIEDERASRMGQLRKNMKMEEDANNTAASQVYFLVEKMKHEQLYQDEKTPFVLPIGFKEKIIEGVDWRDIADIKSVSLDADFTEAEVRVPANALAADTHALMKNNKYVGFTHSIKSSAYLYVYEEHAFPNYHVGSIIEKLLHQNRKKSSGLREMIVEIHHKNHNLRQLLQRHYRFEIKSILYPDTEDEAYLLSSAVIKAK